MPQPQSVTPVGRFLGNLPPAVAAYFGINFGRLGPWQQVFFQVTLFACLLNCCASVFDFLHYGGTDLRARVVGARALLRGLDPYTLTTSPDLPPTLQDPDQEHAGLSRCTYPPSLLLVYAVFSPLPYQVQRGLWMVLEWSALVAMLALLARLVRAHQTRYLFVVTAMALVVASYFWRLHVERGQYYVFIGLLLSAAISLCSRGRAEHAGAGFLLGVAIALRPTAVFMLIPLWIMGARKTVLSALLSVTVLVALTLPFTGLVGWRNFSWLGAEWEHAVMEPGYLDKAYPRLPQTPEPVDGFQPEGLPGLSGNLALSGAFGALAERVLGLPASLGGPVLSRVTFLLVLAVFTALCFFARYRRVFTRRRALTAAVLMMLVADYFLPIRIVYGDVLLCIPIALVMPALTRPNYRPFFIFMVGAFLLWLVPISGPFNLEYRIVANGIRLCAVLYVCALYVCARPLTRVCRQR